VKKTTTTAPIPAAPIAYRLHPWHGVAIGAKAPRKLNAYIEVVPTDTVKYELDKASGYLKIDRPQKFSNVCPTLYGLVPRTYCGPGHGALTCERTGRTGIVGDGDPLDICVLAAEKAIPHGDILVPAIVVGGLRMLDGNQADDKILAVLEGDALYGGWQDVEDLPRSLVDRIQHYFLTYKRPPGTSEVRVEIVEVYGREEAYTVVRRCMDDYAEHFGREAPRMRPS
jgi:inorganic pyrophosphatase